MDSGSLVVCIGDRDALPVRAIPLLTGWKVSPDVVAKRLARQGNLGLGQGLGGALLPAGKVAGEHAIGATPGALAAFVHRGRGRHGVESRRDSATPRQRSSCWRRLNIDQRPDANVAPASGSNTPVNCQPVSTQQDHQAAVDDEMAARVHARHPRRRIYRNTATFTLKRSASFLANCLLISRLPYVAGRP